MSAEYQSKPSTKSKLNLSLDYRLIVLLLLAVIAAMVLVWRPWSAVNASERSVEVTGEASLMATPDEFIFYPSYQVAGKEKQAALDELNKKTETVVAELKKLGVATSAIKTNTSGYDYPAFKETGDGTTYSAQITVTLTDQALTQKVQDYLVTTSPAGSISPQFGFSDKTRKELEHKARDEATKEARVKAEQMGKNLGFKVGKVKTVADGNGFNGSPILYSDRAASTMIAPEAATSLPVNPGENKLPYSVTVTYFIR